jgi:chorismate--pyruvate lyase
MRTRLHRETWHPSPPRASVPPALLPWLTDPASLTARIRARCETFSVRVLRQTLAPVCADEAALLGLRAGELARLREVLLLADGRPVVFARSVLPRHNLRGGWALLRGIGARPLGAVLFANPAIERSPLVCGRFDRRDARYHRARAALLAGGHDARLPPALWARRSVFRFRGRALMVSEFFLPAIFELPQ